MNILFEKNIYKEVIEMPEFKRLKNISFLGILDYCEREKKNTSSRFEHSLAVAKKCLRYVSKNNFSDIEATYIVLGGLLHDIGHCSFSHSLELVFKKRFSISHHDMTKKIILSSSNLAQIWSKYKIDPYRIISTIEGNSDNQSDKVITKLPINFDTLDGIARTESHYKNTNAAWEFSKRVSDMLCDEGKWDNYIGMFDLFWEQKERVYSSYIYNDQSTIIESYFQKLFLNESSLSIDDFLLDEKQMQAKFTWLDSYIRKLSSSGHYYFSKNTKEVRNNDPLKTKTRTFKVDPTQNFSIYQNKRYLVFNQIKNITH